MSNKPREGTRKRVGLSAITIAVCFAIIASISTLDALLVAWNPSIESAEKNPICLALIQIHHAFSGRLADVPVPFGSANWRAAKFCTAISRHARIGFSTGVPLVVGQR